MCAWLQGQHRACSLGFSVERTSLLPQLLEEWECASLPDSGPTVDLPLHRLPASQRLKVLNSFPKIWTLDPRAAYLINRKAVMIARAAWAEETLQQAGVGACLYCEQWTYEHAMYQSVSQSISQASTD